MHSTWRGFCLSLPLALAFGGAASAAPASQPAPKKPAAKSAQPTAEDAKRFVDEAEKRLLPLAIEGQRTSWVMSNFITYDTQQLSAESSEKSVAAGIELAKQAARFNDVKVSADVRRKLDLIKNGLTLAAPSDPAKIAELSQLSASLEGAYGSGKYCFKDGKCLSGQELEEFLANRDNDKTPEQLLEAWAGWHAIAKPMRKDYARLVELANQGARELGYADSGAMWRSKYDMPPDAFAKEMDRLWSQVEPLYKSLHCYVRAELNKKYGDQQVPLDQAIPAHLLGNMWAQTWDNVYPIMAPPNADPGYNLTERLRDKKLDAVGMVRYGEGFFTSLGFAPLPETFFERSLFTEPKDRNVVCHASAWDVDFAGDLRIKMCININDEDFRTIHHELGHNFYQRAYDHQPFLYRDSANDGFHEAVGDTIALSITPEYLKKVGLIDTVPDPSKDMGLLLKQALDKIAFLPFGLLIDQWRWKVFNGEIDPAHYNQGWWDLRLKYQGVRPPVARSEEDFDPAAKYHVAASTPYARYFLAHILQYQFHRGLCKAAGYEGPLNRCSIYGNKEAGERLQKMLAMGSSRPWPEALEAVDSRRDMDATAVLDYFAPLKAWLDQQNQGRKCGW
jgi:peptidyl-dipeptidase A